MKQRATTVVRYPDNDIILFWARFDTSQRLLDWTNHIMDSRGPSNRQIAFGVEQRLFRRALF